MKLNYTVRIAQECDHIHAENIVHYIERASNDPSNGICKRSTELIQQKIKSGDAIIAVSDRQKWIGFCYLQEWEDGFVSSCALIVHPKYRKGNIARQLKQKSIELAKQKYPSADYFGLTTSLAVMKINSELGYRPVTYSEITTDEKFWSSCQSCMNYAILKSKEKKNCLCTAMLYDKKHES